jgi:hypothetical protein
VTETEQSTADPQFVVLAGDWHGNVNWVLNYALPQAQQMFTQVQDWNERKIIIQLGDFGFRPVPGNEYLEAISQALVQSGMELWWIDGNHEDWPGIRDLVIESGNGIVTEPVPLPGLPAIRYLPRGTRWTWRGKRWLAVGGAVSVDKLMREEGVDWWPDEEITPVQADAIIAAGPADVLLSHDVPDCWFPSNLGAPADGWLPMIPVARAHSRLLENIAAFTEVTRNFHGHYHVSRNDWYKETWRGGCDVHVTGLTLDGYNTNLQLVDVERL